MPTISRLTRSKFLKRTNIGSAASMASMIGALKSGALMASTDRAKQKEVMVSIVKHRNAKKRSDDRPASY